MQKYCNLHINHLHVSTTWAFSLQVSSLDPLAVTYFSASDRDASLYSSTETTYEIVLDDIVQKIDDPLLHRIGDRLYFKFDHWNQKYPVTLLWMSFNSHKLLYLSDLIRLVELYRSYIIHSFLWHCQVKCFQKQWWDRRRLFTFTGHMNSWNNHWVIASKM